MAEILLIFWRISIPDAPFILLNKIKNETFSLFLSTVLHHIDQSQLGKMTWTTQLSELPGTIGVKYTYSWRILHP